MKYLKKYNESLKNTEHFKKILDDLTPAKRFELYFSYDMNFYTEEELVEKIFKNIPISVILIKSLNKKIKKGLEYLCKYNMLNTNTKYIIEKYELNLHQNEPLKDFEIWIIEQIKSVKPIRAMSNYRHLIYKNNNGDVLFNYKKDEKLFLYDQSLITIPLNKFDIKMNVVIDLFIKKLATEYLNIDIDELRERTSVSAFWLNEQLKNNNII